MTIIFQQGGIFWIEFLAISVVINNAAGNYTSAVANLERPGRYIGAQMTNISPGQIGDNAENTGTITLRNQAAGLLTYGQRITGLIGRVQKALGTSGDGADQLMHVIVFLRK